MLNLGFLELGRWNSWRTLSSLIETEEPLTLLRDTETAAVQDLCEDLIPQAFQSLCCPPQYTAEPLAGQIFNIFHDADAWSFPADVLDG